jgi:DNA polymerase I-like protein with 3'-5' exonuclease and polymerase domains
MGTNGKHDPDFPADARSAAAAYLRLGLSPIPLPHRSKDPGRDGWQDLRLTPETLDEHFPAGQPRNVGVLNGAPSGNTADVDLDCGQAVAAASTVLPPTGFVFGRHSAPCSHRVYVTDPPFDRGQEAYKDLDGTMLVELRGSGGQTVYPPSAHAETGETIRWVRFERPARLALSELRQAVRELAAVCLMARHWPEKGSRQDAFLALSGGLIRAGWQPGRVERFLDAVAAATGDEEARKRHRCADQTAARLRQERKASGWPTLERLLGAQGRAVLRRVREWLGITLVAAVKVRTLEPYQPFPVEALPEPLREYVRQGAAALGCDPGYVALPALAVAAAAIGNTRVIRLKRGWEEPCILWTAVVGDSGTLKSPAYLKAVGHFFRTQRRLIQEYKVRLADYRERLAEYKEAKKQADKDGIDPGDPPEQPVLLRIVCSDSTIEKLAEILEDNPRGVLLARDELAGWLGSFGRYKGKQGGTDLPAWLEFFRAGNVLIDRKTAERKNTFVERAAVSVTGGIQPGVLARALTPEFLDAGLAARLLMAMPPKQRKRWTEAEIDPDTERAYHDALDKQQGLQFDTSSGEDAPHVLHLSAEAKACWVSFYDVWAGEQAGAEGDLAAAFSKLEGYAARFTLVHHVLTHVGLDTDDRRPVGPRSVEAGVELSRWFASEARRIYATLSEGAEEREARRLVEFIRTRGGSIMARALQKSNSRKYPTAEVAEAALEELVAAGLGDWDERPAGFRGGHPSRVFVLHPTPDTTDTTSEDPDDDGGDAGACPTDTTPDTTPPGSEIPRETEGCVGSVGRRMQSEGHGDAPVSDVLAEDRHTGATEVVSDSFRAGGRLTGYARGESSPPYLLVADSARLDTVLTALDGCDRVAVDLETTGLDPRAERVRLVGLSVATVDGGNFCYLVDCFHVDPTPLWEVLSEKELVFHNAVFDLRFLGQLGFTPGRKIHDTMLLAQLLFAGTGARASLAACCERWLGRRLDKAAQKSDWSGTLSAGQLAYAATDLAVLDPLLEALQAEIAANDLAAVAAIESRCLLTLAWMAGRGVAFDAGGWRSLARAAQEEAGNLRRQLDQVAPPRPGTLLPGGWNWDSPAQVKEVLALAGCDVPDTAEATLAAVDQPLVGLLRRYRDARKRAGTYGDDWLAHVAEDGRVYPSWRQLGAASGRMSCSNPNMQQLPRGGHRRCIAAPPGRVLVKADYSQIELRIAAKVSGDAALLDAYRKGEDLHARTGRAVLGAEEVTKEQRQLAKALNFGLLYGMGAKGFRDYARAQYALELTEAQARGYRDAYFKTYPGLRTWHRRVGTSGRRAVATRTLTGRRRLEVGRFTEKLNTPVQGTGADGLKLALAMLWERRTECPGAFPVLAVHDELVLECDDGQAESVAAWLKTAMIDAMTPLIDPVPVEVEVKVARTWAGD